MQPYQLATQEAKERGELPLRLLKKGASLAGTAASFTAGGSLGKGLLSKVAPLLSKYIPEDLMKKGLSKLDPRFGKFIDESLKAGDSIDQIRDFIGNKISSQNEVKKKNIIEEYSPELFQFLKEEIESGRAPIEAGAIAQSKNHFKDVIKKMSKDHKADFSSIIETIFGNAQQPKEQMQEKSGQNPGGIDPQLLSIMQNMQATMNKLSGG